MTVKFDGHLTVIRSQFVKSDFKIWDFSGIRQIGFDELHQDWYSAISLEIEVVAKKLISRYVRREVTVCYSTDRWKMKIIEGI